MSISENDGQIVREVLRRFMENRATTPKRFLAVTYKDPEAPQRLSDANLLESLNNVAYWPKALAFHLCADEALLQEAKRSVAIAARTLQSLFIGESEKTQFGIVDIERAYSCCEILDFLNGVGGKESLAKASQIQPFVRRPP